MNRDQINFGWNCCDGCQVVHHNKFFAWFHWMWLRLRGTAGSRL